jgi:hypothetical protein
MPKQKKKTTRAAPKNHFIMQPFRVGGENKSDVPLWMSLRAVATATLLARALGASDGISPNQCTTRKAPWMDCEGLGGPHASLELLHPLRLRHTAAFPFAIYFSNGTFMKVYKRTVTEKRRAAGHGAAAHPTRPRTEEGKRHSAFSFFTHGLCATLCMTYGAKPFVLNAQRSPCVMLRLAAEGCAGSGCHYPPGLDHSGVDLVQYDQLHREPALAPAS